MHNMIHIFIVIFILLIVLGDSRFISGRGKIHFDRGLHHSRRWERWCTLDIECGRGFCQGYICQCYRGYITWRFMGVCNYEQRTKLTVFLLSFFTGMFGVDWFVLSRGEAGYIIAGIFKLIISFGCIIGWPITIISISKKNSRFFTTAEVISVILSVASFVWWLTDWIRILADVFYDGYGAPLQPWGEYYYYDRLSYRL
ncbi:unnamed protein product [Rotaria sordida]|uniref:Uncharacterized protein n=1 Tax=Rotaria sordida TaxID=392033 RepID=A0A814S2S5_9BILA|nr:unnamed protein product [Rotaria sordida]CAF3593886.1 unnamed protein product [Rotaria sordida]